MERTWLESGIFNWSLFLKIEIDGDGSVAVDESGGSRGIRIIFVGIIEIHARIYERMAVVGGVDVGACWSA